MRIVITGSESFIGRQLQTTCAMRGVDHAGIDLVTASGPNHIQGDICSPEIALRLPDGADAMVHLAAVSTDKACRENTEAAFAINVGGTLNLMKAAQARGIKQFIFASTEWVYGDVSNAATQTEDTVIDANRISSEYALTKMAGERLLAAAQARGAFNVTVLRFGIVYGPRPANWSAVEALFNGVRRQDAVEVGSLATARRFIHVSDIASGILSAVGRTGFEVFNLAGNRLITLRDVIEKSCSILGRNPRVVEKNPSAVSIRNPESSRARAALNWEPTIDLESGLRTLL